MTSHKTNQLTRQPTVRISQFNEKPSSRVKSEFKNFDNLYAVTFSDVSAKRLLAKRMNTANQVRIRDKMGKIVG